MSLFKSRYEKNIGSRAQVWHGTAYKTSGGLTRKDLLKNKNGRIVSRKKHYVAKNEKRLLKYGYGAKKGKFGYIKVTPHLMRRHTRRRGGSGMRSLTPSELMSGGLQPLNPSQIDYPAPTYPVPPINELPPNMPPSQDPQNMSMPSSTSSMMGGRRRRNRRSRRSRRSRRRRMHGGGGMYSLSPSSIGGMHSLSPSSIGGSRRRRCYRCDRRHSSKYKC